MSALYMNGGSVRHEHAGAGEGSSTWQSSVHAWLCKPKGGFALARGLPLFLTCLVWFAVWLETRKLSNEKASAAALKPAFAVCEHLRDRNGHYDAHVNQRALERYLPPETDEYDCLCIPRMNNVSRPNCRVLVLMVYADDETIDSHTPFNIANVGFTLSTKASTATQGF
jgi:hypothetical protein